MVTRLCVTRPAGDDDAAAAATTTERLFIVRRWSPSSLSSQIHCTRGTETRFLPAKDTTRIPITFNRDTSLQLRWPVLSRQRREVDEACVCVSSCRRAAQQEVYSQDISSAIIALQNSQKIGNIGQFVHNKKIGIWCVNVVFLYRFIECFKYGNI